MEDTICCFCDQVIVRRAKTVTCDGFCGKLFHADCFNLSADILKNINKVSGLSWKCPTCYDDTKSNEGKFKAVRTEIGEMFNFLKIDFMKWADKKFEDLNNNSKPVGTKLYSAVVESKSAVMIKPKNQLQKNNVTKTEILQHINPVASEIEISGVKNINKGGILIGCQDNAGVSKFKELALQKLGDKYDIKDVANFNPRIRLVGMTDKFSAEDIVNFVEYQNKSLISEKFECKVLQISSTKKNKDIYQAVLQIDVDSYNKIMSTGNGKLFVGYNICDVYDSIEIKRCFNCSGFNHFSKSCNNQLHCPLCSDGHMVKDCKNSVLKCINCVKYNEINKSNISIDHAAWDSKECFVFKQKISEFKSHLQFSN